MKSVAVSPGQNIYDIAVQEYGSIEGILKFRENSEFSFTQDINPGEKIEVHGNVVNRNVQEFLKLYPKIATGNDFSQNILEGINYWAIEVDFVVS